MLGALAEAFLLKRYEEQNAVKSLENEVRAIEDAKKALEDKANAERKAALVEKVQQQRHQGGASTPMKDADNRFDLSREQKVGPSAMGVASLRKMKRQATQGKLTKRDAQAMPESPFGFSQSSRGLVDKGFRDSGGARVRRKNGFYSVPLVKYLLRAVTHVLFLMLYAEVLTHLLTVDQLTAIAPKLPPLTFGESVLIMWSLTLGYEHRRREMEMRGLGLSTALPLKSLVNWAHVILFVAISLRLSTLVPDYGTQWAYTYYQMLVSFDAVLMMCEMFTFMWTSVNFGVLTITLV